LKSYKKKGGSGGGEQDGERKNKTPPRGRVRDSLFKNGLTVNLTNGESRTFYGGR